MAMGLCSFGRHIGHQGTTGCSRTVIKKSFTYGSSKRCSSKVTRSGKIASKVSNCCYDYSDYNIIYRIHSQGCQTKLKDQPDSRAIFFEHVMYSKRKIGDFVSILDGLRLSFKVLEIFNPALERYS